VTDNVAEAKREEAAAQKGLKRTNSELEMLAEKAALLSRSGQDEEEPEIATTPTRSSRGTETTVEHLTSPGEQVSDPIILQSRVQIELFTPTSTPNKTSNVVLSEKARGKMRATESFSPGETSPTEEVDVQLVKETDEELMRLASEGVGPNRYVPTEGWVASWQKGLPLDPVLVAISELLPKIQDSQSKAGAPSSKVFKLLKGEELGGVLPPPAEIMPRRFHVSVIAFR
jgi:hypothetical protein